MAPLEPTALAALLISALLMLLLLARRRKSATDMGTAAAAEVLDTVQAWPPQAVRILTLPERLAFGTLRRALPRHLVLAQVPLSRFISVPPGPSYAQWLTRAGRLNVDLLVCDASSRVLAAVELRSADQTPRSIARQARKTQVLEAAGVRVHVWRDTDIPSIAEVRELFRSKGGKLPIGEDSVDIDGRPMIPVPEMQELLMEGDELDYNHLNEPVPSGFFEDLDAAARTQAARR
jgi:hypothetical protein